MNSYAIKAGAELPSIATSMYVGAIGDFNGDGKADLAWRNNGTGTNAMWLMDGTSIVTGAFLPEVSDVGMNIEGPW